MIETLMKIFGFGNKTDFVALLEQGALIVDVRTPAEFKGGHIKGAVNIPLDQLRGKVSQLKSKHKAIITCCASGMRSASAKGILESQGVEAVYNGGSWTKLQMKIKN